MSSTTPPEKGKLTPSAKKDDKACSFCEADFGFFNWAHKCFHCSAVACDKCAPKRRMDAASDKQRICMDCFSQRRSGVAPAPSVASVSVEAPGAAAPEKRDLFDPAPSLSISSPLSSAPSLSPSASTPAQNRRPQAPRTSSTYLGASTPARARSPSAFPVGLWNPFLPPFFSAEVDGGGADASSTSAAAGGFVVESASASARRVALPQGLFAENATARHVFLSHVQSTGGDLALALSTALLSANVTTWYDQNMTPWGLTAESMKEGVRRCDLFCLIVTPGVFASKYVRMEIAEALAHGKQMLLLIRDGLSGAAIELQVQEGIKDIKAAADGVSDSASSTTPVSSVTALDEAALARLMDGAGTGARPDCVGLFMGERLVSVTVAAVQRALFEGSGGRVPRRRRPLEHRLGSFAMPKKEVDETGVTLDVFLVGVAGSPFIEYLRRALLLVCPTMRVAVFGEAESPGAAGRAGAAALSSSFLSSFSAAAHVVALLEPALFASEEVVAALESRFAMTKPPPELLTAGSPAAPPSRPSGLVLLYDKVDTDSFRRIIAATPLSLRHHYEKHPGIVVERNVEARWPALRELLKSVGATERAEDFPIPPPPPFFDSSVCASTLEALKSALASSSRVIVCGGLGGLGKTSVASAFASEPSVRERFDDVLWATVGRSAGHHDLRSTLIAILAALREDCAMESKTSSSDLDALAGFVRQALERPARAVLLVLDDLSARAEHGDHLRVLTGVAPLAGGSCVLATTRDVDECRRYLPKASQPAVCHMEPLPVDVAAGLLARSSKLPPLLASSGSSGGASGGGAANAALCRLAEEVGRSTYALQLVARILRLTMVDDYEGRTQQDRAAAACDDLRARISRASPPEALMRADAPEGSAPVYRTIEIALAETFAAKDRRLISLFGLFEGSVEVPVNILHKAWGRTPFDCGDLLERLVDAAFIKRGRHGVVQLHDFAWDFAHAEMAASIAGADARQRAFLDRVKPSIAEVGTAAEAEVLTWAQLVERTLAPPLKDEASAAYLLRSLLHHLRAAKRDAEFSNLLFSFDWLVAAMRSRGVHAVIRDLVEHTRKIEASERIAEREIREKRRAEAVAGAAAAALQLQQKRETKSVLKSVIFGAAAAASDFAASSAARQRLEKSGSMGKLATTSSSAAPAEELPAASSGTSSLLPAAAAAATASPSSAAVATAVPATFSAKKTATPGLSAPEGPTQPAQAVLPPSSAAAPAPAPAAAPITTTSHLRDLFQVLQLSAPGLTAGHGLKERLVAQLIGRLRGSSALAGSQLSRLLEEAEAEAASAISDCAVRRERGEADCADFEGEIWLLPLAPLLQGPGGALQVKLVGHTEPINTVCELPGGLLASGGEDRNISLWFADTGERLKVLEGDGDTINCLCVVPISGSDFIASASENGTISLWSVDTSEREWSVPSARGDGGVRCICILPPPDDSGRILLASGSDSGEVCVRDALSSGASVWRRAGHAGAVNALCELPPPQRKTASPEASMFLSGGADGVIKFWRTDDGECIASIAGHAGPVLCLCSLGVPPSDGAASAAPVAPAVASGSADGTIKLWGRISGVGGSGGSPPLECFRSLLARAEGATKASAAKAAAVAAVNALSVCFLSTGGVFAASFDDGSIKLWDLSTWYPLPVASITHQGSVRTICGLLNGLLASACDDDITLWRLDTPDRRSAAPLPARKTARVSVAAKKWNQWGTEMKDCAQESDSLVVHGSFPIFLDTTVELVGPVRPRNAAVPYSTVSCVTESGDLHEFAILPRLNKPRVPQLAPEPPSTPMRPTTSKSASSSPIAPAGSEGGGGAAVAAGGAGGGRRDRGVPPVQAFADEDSSGEGGLMAPPPLASASTGSGSPEPPT